METFDECLAEAGRRVSETRRIVERQSKRVEAHRRSSANASDAEASSDL
jgi:hypothetical protein